MVDSGRWEYEMAEWWCSVVFFVWIVVGSGGYW